MWHDNYCFLIADQSRMKLTNFLEVLGASDGHFLLCMLSLISSLYFNVFVFVFVVVIVFLLVVSCLLVTLINCNTRQKSLRPFFEEFSICLSFCIGEGGVPRSPIQLSLDFN